MDDSKQDFIQYTFVCPCGQETLVTNSELGIGLKCEGCGFPLGLDKEGWELMKSKQVESRRERIRDLYGDIY